jgi:hypothetical protein
MQRSKVGSSLGRTGGDFGIVAEAAPTAQNPG